MNVIVKIDVLIGCEGGFLNDLNDCGNWYFGKLEGIMWGVMVVEVCVYGYMGLMKDMLCLMVVVIYELWYWW